MMLPMTTTDLVSSGKYSPMNKTWTIRVSRGGRKATATGPVFVKTYKAALAALAMLEDVSSGKTALTKVDEL